MKARSFQRNVLVSLTWLFSLYWSAGSAEGNGTGYVYAYFKGGWPTGGASGVFLSFSTDGLHFESLNDGNPVFTPPQPADFPAGENQTRDPSVVYGPDGLFHMVWTSGITTRTIGYASSPNLKDWSTPQRIRMWDEEVAVDHTWAPEIFFDDRAGEYRIVFASNLNGGDHRLYSTTTRNFSSFSTPQTYYYAGNTVIDGMVAKDEANNRWLMAIKDERGGAKNISIATSPSAAGPWTTNNPVVIGPGSSIEPNAVEGPSLLKIGDTWHLYYDAYGAHYLGVATSTDLANWVNRTNESTMPAGPNPHHGTVFVAPLDKIGFELPMMRSDLNDDSVIDLNDWLIFSSHHLADLSGIPFSSRDAYGDINGDGVNDVLDFRLFKADYNALNGAGQFEAAISSLTVPEPVGAPLFWLAAWAALLRSHWAP